MDRYKWVSFFSFFLKRNVPIWGIFSSVSNDGNYRFGTI